MVTETTEFPMFTMSIDKLDFGIFCSQRVVIFDLLF